MEIKGVNILEELKKYHGADVLICIYDLYGIQKYKCNLDYIFDDKRIGFKFKDREIFIYRVDLVDYSIKDGIYFADDVRKISIKLNSAVI